MKCIFAKYITPHVDSWNTFSCSRKRPKCCVCDSTRHSHQERQTGSGRCHYSSASTTKKKWAYRIIPRNYRENASKETGFFKHTTCDICIEATTDEVIKILRCFAKESRFNLKFQIIKSVNKFWFKKTKTTQWQWLRAHIWFLSRDKIDGLEIATTRCFNLIFYVSLCIMFAWETWIADTFTT